MPCGLCGGGDRWIKTCASPPAARACSCATRAGRSTPPSWDRPRRPRGGGPVRFVRGLRQPARVRTSASGGARAPTRARARRVRERDVDGTGKGAEPAAGFRLDRSDPEVWA